MNALRYLALGDSYTIGESVPEAERFPNQLGRLLTERGYPAEVTVLARTGWTTDELLHAISHAELQRSFEVVTLLIGVNNQFRGLSIEAYRGEIENLLRLAVGFAGKDIGRVFVLSIPDWGVTPFAAGRDLGQIAASIDSFNAVNRAEANAAGISYVDITDISREAAHQPQLLAADGLHPSGAMYGLWVERLLPLVLAAVAQK